MTDNIIAPKPTPIFLRTGDVVATLRKRADWLRSEYLAGGDYEHLSAREKECRAMADKLERGELP